MLVRFNNAELSAHSIFEHEKSLDLFRKQGFFILENRENLSPENYIELFKVKSGLGGYFQSEFNKNYHASNIKGNVSLIGQIDKGIHPSFNTCNGQDFHVDGTFELIGTVKTSVLYCVENADVGGESILFDANGAFIFLEKNYPHCAVALMNEKSLVRRSTTGTEDFCIGPAFKYNQNKLYTRFTIDISACWEEAYSQIDHLEEAVNIMRDIAQPGSPYYLQFALAPQHMIVFENDTLCHGRLSYQQFNKQRLMIRALFYDRFGDASFISQYPIVNEQKSTELFS